ncbi:biopolymer transporter ExbD [Pseudovibrio sp. SPO723]|uniref:ExbD/TolR family protein n=1 Tax=Nesiotobacter zosterae TaxID=392721 RepID=UPI0029C32E7F|nr:biopolymer transporter ExbD [Pseudovibrio sp. SPO723]MDX5592421.1 biopolymer transporter ExbD [Pseudovibrio sp. SPO723]
MQLGNTRRRSRAPSLTSLIDVIFLLLMFFMLASTFSIYQRLDVSSGASGESEHAQKPVIIRVQNAELVVVDGIEVSAEGLGAHLAEMDLATTQLIAVLPESESVVQDVVSVLELVTNAGFKPTLVGSSSTSEAAQ